MLRIWPAQLSEQLPGCKFEGLDIDLTKQPPSAWLSPAVSFTKFDIFADLTEEFGERYDIINVQYTITFVSDHAFPGVLEKVIRMLSKPSRRKADSCKAH